MKIKGLFLGALMTGVTPAFAETAVLTVSNGNAESISVTSVDVATKDQCLAIAKASAFVETWARSTVTCLNAFDVKQYVCWNNQMDHIENRKVECVELDLK